MFAFMKGDRRLTSSGLSTSNVALVLGPSKSGKSYLIKKSLAAMARSEMAGNSLLIHIDLSGYGMLSFDVFRHRFEAAIIDQIAEGVTESQASYYFEAIETSLRTQLDPQMMKLLLLKSIGRLVNDCGHFRISLEGRQQLADIYYQISEIEFDGHQVFAQVADLLASDTGRSQLEGRLLLLRELAVEKDCLEAGENGDLKVSGIEVDLDDKFVDMFFDMLNYVAGYHAQNNFEEHQTDLSAFVDVVLAIGNLKSPENFDIVSQLEFDPRAKRFVDHLCLKLYTDNYSRNHFPVVIESSDSQFWSHTIFSKLDIDVHHYPAFDLYSPTFGQIKSTFLTSFQGQDSWAAIRYAVLAGIEHRRLKLINERHHPVIEAVAADMMEKEQVTFEAKLCRALADDGLAMLSDSEADVLFGRLTGLLQQFGLEKNKLGLFTRFHATAHYYDDDLIAVLARHRLLYFKRHHAMIALDSPVYTAFCRKFVASLKSRIGLWHRLKIMNASRQESYFFPNYIWHLTGAVDAELDRYNLIGQVDQPEELWGDLILGRQSSRLT